MYPSGEMTKNLIEARWHGSREVPLAYGHPGNIITPRQEEQWLHDLSRYSRHFPNDVDLKPFVSNGQLDSDQLQKKYRTELRFLSAPDMMLGLKEFAAEISGTFSPENALFFFPSESYSYNLLYQTLLTLKPSLTQYGIAKDSPREFKLLQKNRFAGNSLSQAKAFLYIDDWILSAEHLSSFLSTDVAGRFHTFHLVVSDAGLNFLKGASRHLNPRFKYKIRSDNPKSLLAEVPLYGVHKIPDRLPKYYAPNHHDLYSIFGRDAVGDYILSNNRLVDHNKPLVA